MREINHIAIHCSATQPNAKVENIQKYWKEVLGWHAPGYHDIISADGTIHDLLPYQEISNGVKGFNHDTVNVCYIGGIDRSGHPTDTRTPQQKEALIKLLTELKELFPLALIQGHRDFSPDLDGDGIIEECEWVKSCPSFDAKSEYASIK